MFVRRLFGMHYLNPLYPLIRSRPRALEQPRGDIRQRRPGLREQKDRRSTLRAVLPTRPSFLLRSSQRANAGSHGLAVCLKYIALGNNGPRLKVKPAGFSARGAAAQTGGVFGAVCREPSGLFKRQPKTRFFRRPRDVEFDAAAVTSGLEFGAFALQAGFRCSAWPV